MKVFVTGATGIIGSAVAAACSRAGHEVFGLTRSKSKAKHLERMEVRPVIGSMQESGSFRLAASQSQVLIHCAAEYSPEFLDLDKRMTKSMLEYARETRCARVFIYTSGVWVYGNSGTGIADEASLLHPPAFLKTRVETERLVLEEQEPKLRTFVVRPGCVYGGAGSLTASWFESASEHGEARYIGDGKNRWTMIHRDDLADLYVRIAESSLNREIFNATDRSRFTVLECAEAASRIAGGDGKVASVAPESDAGKALGPMIEGVLLNQHVDSSKAVRLLNWNPKHAGFVDGVDRYHLAWRSRHGS